MHLKPSWQQGGSSIEGEYMRSWEAQDSGVGCEEWNMRLGVRNYALIQRALSRAGNHPPRLINLHSTLFSF